MAAPASKVSVFPRKAPVPRKRVFRLSKSKLPIFILVLLMFYLSVSFTVQFHRLSALRREINQVQLQLGEVQAKNAELREQLKKVQSDEYVEQVAREKLGLVKPGEVKIVPAQTGSGER